MNNNQIEEQNAKIAHVLWIILISMITAVVTTLLAIGSAGL